MIKRRFSFSWSWNAFIAITLLAAAVWTLFPIYWMLATSLKPNLAVFESPPSLWPKHPTFENYANALFGDSSIFRYFLNSAITSIGTVVLAIALAVMCGYALSRLRFRFRKSILIGVLVTQMFPLVVLLIPLYLLYLKIGLLNTYIGLILGFTSFTLPFGIWMIKGFVDTIPIEIEDAAMVDGCTQYQSLRIIVLPLILPGVAATGVFAFMDAWNNLLFPLTLVNDIHMKTLPPGMVYSFAGQFKHDWGGMMAASTMVSIPVVAGYVFMQRYMVEGLTGGSIKG